MYKFAISRLFLCSMTIDRNRIVRAIIIEGHIYLTMYSSILQIARVLSLLRSKQIVRLCTWYFLQKKNLFVFISYFISANCDFQAEGWLVEKVRSEKFVTRSRRCMNHLVRTVNGERVVSQIRNDFTVSSSNISLDVFPS